MKYLFLFCIFLFNTNLYAQGTDQHLKGNVQVVMKNMLMKGSYGDTIRMKTTLKYDDNNNLAEEIHYMDDGNAINHKVIYAYNTANLLMNKTRYMQGNNHDNGIIVDIYSYDDKNSITKEKTTTSRRSDSIIYWYIAGEAGNTIRYGVSTLAPGDTTVTTIDVRGNITGIRHTSSGQQFAYTYNDNDNVIEETSIDAATGKIKTRIVNEYNIDHMPVTVKEYNGDGKLLDESTSAYTNMDDHGNYLTNTCLRNGKLAYVITSDIIYR